MRTGGEVAVTREEAIKVFNELKKCYLGGIVDAINMAIEALKVQEPRLVTESDFDGADEYGYIPVWTEEKDGDMYWECIPKVAITDPDGIEVLRYWTSRPTDKQREAIPW